MRFVKAIAFCALSAAFVVPAYAGGYLVDKNGNVIKSANTGRCFRSTGWSKDASDRACLALEKALPQYARK
jgi:hypothetical protein